MADAENEAQEAQILIEPAQMAGVWANFARVSHSKHEFTLDFVRMENGNPPQGIVVARVSVSPLFITQLITALQDNWDKFAKKALPKEVYRDEQSEDNPADND